ncbi:hypothetical protein N9D59_08015, partial [Burkholderiaceae bacterium]|nr:hypothetical protein [Burkholderiaceae bacterium]
MTFNGSDYADVSMGGLGDDVLRGKGGDDYFIVGAGDDYVDGDEGVDTVELTGRPLDFSVDLQANGEVLITYIGAEFHPFHVDTLTLKDVEYLRFEVEGESDSYYRSMPVLHHGVRVVDGEVVSAAGDYSKAYNPEAWQTLTQGLADDLGYSIVEGTNARNENTAPSGQSALFGYAGDDRFFIETSAGSKTLAYGDGGWDELRLERLDGSATITIDDRRVQLSDGQEVLYAGIDRIRGTDGSDTVTLSDSDGLRDDTGEVIMLGSHLNYQSMGGSDTVTLSFGSSGNNESPADTFMAEYDWVESGGIDLSFTAANTARVSYVGGMDTLVNVQLFRDSNQADTLDFSGQDRAYWSYVKVTGGDDIVIGGDTSVSYDGHSRNDLSENSLGITIDFSKAVVDSSGRTTLMVDARELVSWDGVSFGVDTLIDVTRIYGSYAADTFIGDHQNNTFRGEEGDDYLNGGGGWDTASYRNADHAIQVDMAAGVVSAKDYDGDSLYSDGTDTLREMEAVQGTTYADYYDASAFGAAGAFNIGSEGVYNRFEGRGGDDVIVGNGYTQVAYWGAAMGVSVDLNTGIADVADVEDKGLSLYQETLGRDTFSGVSAVSGSNYDDIFIGTDVSTADHGYRFWEAGLVERFEGRGGSDTINGGSGGLNVAEYRWESGAVSIDLSAGQAKQYEGEIADSVLLATDTLINIHEVRGTNFGDRWIGSDNGGSDIWFRGVDNVQNFSGGAGDDWIDGRGGINEAAYWFDPAAVTVDLRADAPRISAEGLDWIMVTDGFGDTDYLRNIQWLEGTNFNDTFYGDDADNFIDGRRGDDFIDGGSGSDTAEYNQTSGGVFVNLSAGKAFEGYQLTASSGDVYAATASGEFEDTLVSIENVVGSLADDYLIGDAQNNSFDGLLGHDVVAGGGGIDTLILRGNQDEFVVAHLGADAYRIESLDGSVVVTAHDIEMLAFADKDVALNRVFVSGDSVLLPEGDSGVTDYTFGIEL